MQDAFADQLMKTRSQYESWLKQKDIKLGEFVEKFNVYRKKKLEQLRMCEKEIISMFEYTEKVDSLLDDLESGQFKVRQQMDEDGDRASFLGAIHSASGKVEGGNERYSGVGKQQVVIPKGARPANPLKSVQKSKPSFELSRKLITRYRERLDKIKTAKEAAFYSTMQFTALQAGLQNVNAIDEAITSQTKTKGSDVKGTASSSRPTSARSMTSTAGMQSLGMPKPQRPVSAAPPSQSHVIRSVSPHIGDGAVRVERTFSAVKEESTDGMLSARGSFTDHLHGSADLIQKLRAQEDELRALREEISVLKDEKHYDELNAHHLANELNGNKTFQYIRMLESEQERLKKQVLEVSSQLQHAKVANASLLRTADRKLSERENQRKSIL